MQKISFLKRVVEISKKEMIISPAACGIIGVVSFIALTAAGAFVRIPLPFTPVPITLQTLFVLLSGAMLGRKLGALSQAGYAAIGMLGLPVFAGGAAGALYLLGPTGGYIFGFMVASWVIGKLIRLYDKATLPWIVFSMFIGFLIYFGFGVLRLAMFMNIDLYKAFILGMLPFIPGDLIKITVASLIFWILQKRTREIYPN